MSITAIGPALSLNGPLPRRPRHSLLETEGVLVDEDATRVLNGVNVWGYPTGCSSLWEPCSDGTFRSKGSDSDMPLPRFDSFVVYRPLTCSTISVGDPEEFAARASVTLDATLSAGIEEALSIGVEQSSNPFFGDGNVDDLTSGTAVSAGVALSMLEDAIGDTCRRGMIHATPGVISALQAFPVGGEADSRLITANGTPVVSGSGYIGADTPFLPNPGSTESYMFATGPVEVHLGPLVLGDIRDSLDRSDNTVTFRAERYVLALWDTALQAAALVDWSL
jgi:hypothetical protein